MVFNRTTRIVKNETRFVRSQIVSAAKNQQKPKLSKINIIELSKPNILNKIAKLCSSEVPSCSKAEDEEKTDQVEGEEKAEEGAAEKEEKKEKEEQKKKEKKKILRNCVYQFGNSVDWILLNHKEKVIYNIILISDLAEENNEFPINITIENDPNLPDIPWEFVYGRESKLMLLTPEDVKLIFGDIGLKIVLWIKASNMDIFYRMLYVKRIITRILSNSKSINQRKKEFCHLITRVTTCMNYQLIDRDNMKKLLDVVLKHAISGIIIELRSHIPDRQLLFDKLLSGYKSCSIEQKLVQEFRQIPNQLTDDFLTSPFIQDLLKSGKKVRSIYLPFYLLNRNLVRHIKASKLYDTFIKLGNNQTIVRQEKIKIIEQEPEQVQEEIAQPQAERAQPQEERAQPQEEKAQPQEEEPQGRVEKLYLPQEDAAANQIEILPSSSPESDDIHVIIKQVQVDIHKPPPSDVIDEIDTDDEILEIEMDQSETDDELMEFATSDSQTEEEEIESDIEQTQKKAKQF